MQPINFLKEPMRLPVFLSVSKPYTNAQKNFRDNLEAYMYEQMLYPRTVGKTDYFMDEPLSGCRMVMLESYGLITLAFRRYYIKEGAEYHECDLSLDDNNNEIKPKEIKEKYFTSPWCQIEAAMAYQIGLPILILREDGVSERGLLEKGITDTYLPVFKAEEFNTYFTRPDFRQLFHQWAGRVRRVREVKGTPPKLYQR